MGEELQEGDSLFALRASGFPSFPSFCDYFFPFFTLLSSLCVLLLVHLVGRGDWELSTDICLTDPDFP